MTYPYKLLKCPFCGGCAEIYEPWPHADVKEVYVTHYSDYGDCHAETRQLHYGLRHKTVVGAVNSWNARFDCE